MSGYFRGAIVRVRWPDFGQGTKVHVAIVMRSEDGTSATVRLAVGTSTAQPGESVTVRWGLPAMARWVRGWPQGSTTPTLFYARFIQDVPRDRVERDSPMSDGRIGTMPQEWVDRIQRLEGA